MNTEKLWQIVLGEIELTISKAQFTTWFKNTSVLSQKEALLIVGVPNGFTKEWFEKKYNSLILKTVKGAAPEIKKVEYSIAQPFIQDVPQNKTIRGNGLSLKKARGEFVESALDAQLKMDISTVNKETNLNPRYTFDTYIVGSSNELAHAAATQVVKKPGVSYNPLFLYGGVGLGKTHLLQAIGNEIKQRKPKKRVFYVSSEKFTSEIISSIQEKTIGSLKEKYRLYDVLIIDDIQFLAGKEKTQEEFFHIFNSLYEKGNQIVLSSDRSPKAIATLEERLRSRFEGGMIADVGIPDLETRIAILKSKARERKISLSAEAHEYVATNIHKNIRELEGALNRIAITPKKSGAYSLDEVKSILDTLLFSAKRSINYKQVLKTVAQFYAITEKELLDKNRKKEIVHPRQVTMYLMRTELSCSYPFIGSKMGGRDHTTVMHACGKIENELKENYDTVEEIHAIKERFLYV